MSPNTCVLPDGPLTNDSSNNGPLLQPRALGVAKHTTTVRQSLSLCSDELLINNLGTALNWPNRTEDNLLDYLNSASRSESQVRS
jgi:hypothetical protein